MPRLYEEFADWWPVLSAPGSYVEEAAIFREALDKTSPSPIRTLLELGCGGGNNASHLKRHYAMTLVDAAPGMVEVSRRLNPECEHFVGDMRTVRLGRTFDAVFVHDAISYMTTEADLRAALETVRVHCEDGGVALIVPDQTRETWKPNTHHGGHDVGDRSLRYLEWDFDPDPEDTTFLTTFAFLMREGDGPVRIEYDEHVMGVFPRATWLRLLEEVGFEIRTLPFGHSSFEPDSHCDLYLGLT